MNPRDYGNEGVREVKKPTGRPHGKRGPTRQISLRVPIALLDPLDELAAVRSESRADIIAAALEAWFSAE